MAFNELGIYHPTPPDTFDPAGDMQQQADSLAGHVVVPVANKTERDALATDLLNAGELSDAQPLYVHRTDAAHRVEWTEDGSEWHQVMSKNPMRLLSRVSGNNVASGNTWFMGAGWSPQPGDGGDECGIAYTTGIATLSESGMYRIMIRHVVPVLASGTWTIGLAVNGDTDPVAPGRRHFDQEARGSRVSYEAREPFNAGDTIQAFLRQVSGSTHTVSSADPSRWEIERVGPL